MLLAGISNMRGRDRLVRGASGVTQPLWPCGRGNAVGLQTTGLMYSSMRARPAVIRVNGAPRGGIPAGSAETGLFPNNETI